MTTLTNPLDKRTTLTWNNENKQTRVQKSGTDFTAKYRFDGLRYEKAASGGTTTRFIFDGQNYGAETNTSGTVQTAFTVEPRTYGTLISQRVRTWEDERRSVFRSRPRLPVFNRRCATNTKK